MSQIVLQKERFPAYNQRMLFSGNISTKIIFALILSTVSLFSVSCSGADEANGNSNSNGANKNVNSNANKLSVKDDVAELTTIINFPVQPEEGVWREETVNQKGKKLTAALKFSDENLLKIIAAAEKHKPATQAEIGVDEWFPEELTAQSQLSGNESLKGTVYGANDFFNQTYKNGRLARIQETNYFVLELTDY